MRIPAEMTAAVELAAFVGAATVDAVLVLAVATEAGRFADGDLPAIVAHHTDTAAESVRVVARRGAFGSARHRGLDRIRWRRNRRRGVNSTAPLLPDDLVASGSSRHSPRRTRPTSPAPTPAACCDRTDLS